VCGVGRSDHPDFGLLVKRSGQVAQSPEWAQQDRQHADCVHRNADPQRGERAVLPADDRARTAPIGMVPQTMKRGVDEGDAVVEGSVDDASRIPEIWVCPSRRKMVAPKDRLLTRRRTGRVLQCAT